MTDARIAIATNNGDIGGGEVMLLQIADALRRLGITPVVLGPTRPGDLLAASRARGFETIALPAEGRRAWMTALLRWRLRHPHIPLWCNGLVPGVATAGIGPRLVHLHRVPEGPHRLLARIARLRATRTIAISQHMARGMPGAVVLENWTASIPRAERRAVRGALRIGYLGRLTRAKGVIILIDAAQRLIDEGRDVELVLAGAFVHGAPEDESMIRASLERFTGTVTQLGWTDPASFFDAVDVAAFPSVADEGFGLVAAEAMAAGVPFVVSDSGALPEVVGPDFPWIARRGDAESLARALRERIAEDQGADREGALDRCRRRWEDLFSPDAGMRRIATLLTSLVNTNEGFGGFRCAAVHRPRVR